MTKYKSTSFYLHSAAIFSHLSSPILKTSYRFRRDSIFELEVSKRVAKAMTVVRKPGVTAKWQVCPMFSNSNNRTISHKHFTNV